MVLKMKIRPGLMILQMYKVQARGPGVQGQPGTKRDLIPKIYIIAREMA